MACKTTSALLLVPQSFSFCPWAGASWWACSPSLRLATSLTLTHSDLPVNYGSQRTKKFMPAGLITLLSGFMSFRYYQLLFA